ncbi:hypothetical protein ACI6NF_004521 [Escherichia coli]|uniref:hypothetical protein n=1 Tax=Escherichia coli TaxID=562 RepID=UPI0020234959|nr:hypothetical protein [Escherichia coli]
MIRENSPDLLRHFFYFTLSFRMGLIADKNIKAVTDELVRLERKLTDVLLVEAHHVPNPVSTDDSVDVEDWTPERRFSVVLETATLSEMELADYCRRMGLFVEQVKEWQAISIQAHEKKLTENIRTDRALRDAKNKLRELEKELKRKDKALAEAAALLILREKFNALWDNSEED